MSIKRREFLMSGLAAAGVAAAVPLASSAQASLPQGASRARRIRLGVNYVPSRDWWYAWGEWHPDSIARDLEDVSAIGFDHIRIQLLWPEFQPNASYVSEEKLSRLERLLDLADAAGLDVEVTVLDGQLSGFLFVPSWLIDNQDGKAHDFVADPALIRVQQTLFETLAARIGRHRRFLGFDIANEIHWAALPLGLDMTPAHGDAWMRALIETCDRAAPGKLHVNGVDKYPLEADAPQVFTRHALANTGALSVTHPWEGFGDVAGGLFAQFGPRSVEATHFTEFLIEYLTAFAGDPHRRVWIEEFGCSKEWVDESEIPDWAEKTMRNAASCDRLFGLTWWCSHDPSRRFTGMNALEYSLGLYTNDRRRKPVGDRLRSIVSSFDADPPAPIARSHALVIGDEAGTGSVYPRFVRLLKDGVRPAIVVRSKAADDAYLRERGIETLIR